MEVGLRHGAVVQVFSARRSLQTRTHAWQIRTPSDWSTASPVSWIRSQKEHLAKHLAAELGHRFDGQVFRRLVLIAPPELMGMLRNELPKRVAATIIEEITEDLSQLRAEELADHFRRRHR